MRRPKVRIALVIAVVAVALLSACGSNEPKTTDHVDPQVMSDVVDATFMVPGPNVRRAMRVIEFGRGTAIRECGGEPLSIESTQNRYDQSHFPDLDLIRERGFSEQAETLREDRVLDTLDASCTDLAPDFPSFSDWHALGEAWTDAVMAADQDSRLQSLKAPMADCLVSTTGRDVDEVDPVNSFLRGVSYDASKDGTTRGQIDKWAIAYADCAEDYFAEYRKILLEKRPEMVEKNREVIEAYASELVGAGYVP